MKRVVPRTSAMVYAANSVAYSESLGRIAVLVLVAILFSSHAKGLDQPAPTATRVGVNLQLDPQGRSSSVREYTGTLLRMALDATVPSYGPYEIFVRSKTLPRRRAQQLLKKHDSGLDIEPIPANLALDQTLHEVKIPLVKGLLGYRVLIVHESKVAEFARIRLFSELKKLRTAAKFSWVIADIYRQNAIDFALIAQAETGYTLVSKQRVDYFSRGLHEALNEEKRFFKEMPGIALEQTLAVYSQLPYYFYVNHHKPELARRVQQGLDICIQNGSFEKLFEQFFSAQLTAINLDKRRIFFMPNDNLAADTPYARLELWHRLPDQVLQRYTVTK